MVNGVRSRVWTSVRTTGLLAGLMLMTACGNGTPPAEDTPAPAPAVEAVESLTPESTDAEIMQHLLAVLENQTVSTELSTHFPDLDRARAYTIQRLRLQHLEQTGERVGWKIGWSRQLDPRVPIDPVFGHIMASDVFEPGQPVPTGEFIDGTAGVEAEVVLWMTKDLPGPDVTRGRAIDAIGEVAGAIEVLAPRVVADGDGPNTHNHGIADNVFHIGVMVGADRIGLDEVDWLSETVSVEVNGEAVTQGRVSTTFGRDPIEGVAWIANELHTYGHRLRAGDFVITGTVVTPPQVSAGDTVRLTYSSLGTIDMDIEGGQDP